MTELLQIDPEKRDGAWEEQFFSHFLDSQIRLIHPQAQSGPDGFAYLLAATTEKGESVRDVLAWLSTRGIGLALNPQKEYPDYVFTYGMLWNFRERGEFLTRQLGPRADMRLDLQAGEKVWTRPVDDTYMPAYVRSLLRQFLLEQGVVHPKVLLVSKHSADDLATYDFAVSVESLGSPKASEHLGIAEAISWFLPAHYAVVLVSEKRIDGFQGL